MGKSTATLQQQLEAVQRKLAQHLPNDQGKKSPNSKKDRMYRLLMRESFLEDQIFQSRKRTRRLQKSYVGSDSGTTQDSGEATDAALT